MPSLGPRQLYSLGTVFGQQGVEPKRRRSVKLGDLYLADHKAEVKRISIRACSRVPGCRHHLGPIRANLHPDWGGAMQDTGYEVPRSLLPGNSVNKPPADVPEAAGWHHKMVSSR
jgi:hypothetical protein